MKEHPILFNTEMVKAILDGRKTQTRRIVKYNCFKSKPDNNINQYRYAGYGDTDGFYFIDHYVNERSVGFYKLKCKYEIGDHLWVRETFWELGLKKYHLTGNKYDWIPEPYIKIRYLVDSPEKPSRLNHPLYNKIWRKKPSIFMFRKDSRITLEITKIEIQRLNDITEEEAISEGIEIVVPDTPFAEISNNHSVPEYRNYVDPSLGSFTSPIISFKSLWNSINEKRSLGWDTNPFVWVYTFKVIKPEKVGE